MFTAAVLFLTLSGVMAIEDTRGPYDTQMACEERVQEIARESVQMMAQAVVLDVKGACVKVEPDINSIPLLEDPIG